LAQVSAVVPTRNRSNFLALTLQSVLAQRLVDLEVVVVDEASTDDTAEVIASLRDPRVRVVHHDAPVGVAMARNHGWRVATGNWIAFVDDDDLWAPNKLAAQLTAATETGRDWAYVGVVNMDDAGRIISGVRPPAPEQIMRDLPGYNAVPGGGSNVVARRALLEAVGPFDARHLNTEDWDMWLRLAIEGPPACVPVPLLAYRLHTRNASLHIDAILAGAALIEQSHRAHVNYGMLYRWFGESSLRQGKRAAALRMYALAAARGQLRGVARDLAAIARSRVTRARSSFSPQVRGSPEIDPWCAQAQVWLDELAASAPAH
jgi:glycosyltransferase involved in cell wall biosynthesis